MMLSEWRIILPLPLHVIDASQHVGKIIGLSNLRYAINIKLIWFAQVLLYSLSTPMMPKTNFFMPPSVVPASILSIHMVVVHLVDGVNHAFRSHHASSEST